MKRLKHLKKGLAFLIAAVLIFSVFPTSLRTVRAAEVVTIPDDALRAAIIKQLNLSENDEITKEQLESLIWLDVNGRVSDLTGIEYCTKLGTLKLRLPSDHAVDLTLLANLPKLVFLELSLGKVSSLPQIQNLTTLRIHYCEVLDPESISNLTGLEELDCYETAIEKLPDCSGMNSLKMLTVRETSALTDISGISGCSSLNAVYIERCSNLTDISPLNGLNVKYLNLQLIKITDENEASYMETISSLRALEQLNLYNTGLEDKHVSMFDNLNSLKQLNISTNKLSSADFLRLHKDTLELVVIRSNPISDSAPLGELTKLNGVSVDGTNITDFSFISKLPDLTENCLWYTEWTGSFPTASSTTITDSYDKGTDVYVIQNPFIGADGNRIAPTGSGKYSYNEATGEITVPINDQSTISMDIEFPCTFTTQKGGTLVAKPYIKLNLTQTQAVQLAITTQPQDVEVAEGEDVILTVEASGSGTLSYQWYKDGDIISGATSSSFTISNAALSDSGSYHVVVTNTNSSVTSNPAEITVNAIPLLITTQPQGITLTEGENGTLAVEASGSGTLSYQWYKGDDAISGATSSSLALNNAALSDAGSYTVVVTDKNGSITSAPAVVTVTAAAIPLKITKHPVGADITEGGSATLTVEASGSGTLSYQWYKGNTAISGATSSSLTISNAALSDAGSYTVVVTDQNGSSETSNPAEVTVTIPLNITKHPVGADITEGGNVTLTVEASGSGTLSYQWFKNNTALSGATASALAIINAALSDAGSYHVVVTDTNGNSETSNPAVVTVTATVIPLNITKHPVGVRITEGGNATLTVEASGSGTLSYQWYKGETAISGATSLSLTISDAALSDSGSYHVVVTDENGGSETSDSAVVTVTATVIPLNITKHPVGADITEGGSATLTVEASGSGTLSYQWYKGDDAISGATSSSLTISNATLEDAGSYTVVVTDQNDSSKTSNPAKVTVTAIPLVITMQPQNVNIKEGESATLEVAASGSGALSYQWYKDGKAIIIAEGRAISSVASSSLTISNAALEDAGSYTVVVTDKNGSITSDPIVVTITQKETPAETETPSENEEEAETETADPVQPKAPLTGDSFSWINYIVLFLSAMTTLIWKKSKL